LEERMDIAERIERLKKQAEARKDADERATEETAQRNELWRLEEDAMAAQLREDRPEEQLGIHYDFVRFERYIVAVGMNTSAYRMYENKVVPLDVKKDVRIITGANEALVKRSALLVTDGEQTVTDPEERGKMLTEIFGKFPAAADKLAFLLTELAKGGISARRGKSESS